MSVGTPVYQWCALSRRRPLVSPGGTAREGPPAAESGVSVATAPRWRLGVGGKRVRYVRVWSVVPFFSGCLLSSAVFTPCPALESGRCLH